MAIVLAFDQSYKNTGISVIRDTTIVSCESLSFKKIKTNHEKRRLLFVAVQQMIDTHMPDYVAVERVRMFSRGFVSMKVIIALGNLVAVIVDAAATRKVPVFSVDTRAWKSGVLGNPSATKADAIAFVAAQGFLARDDDAADSACIGLYALQTTAKKQLED